MGNWFRRTRKVETRMAQQANDNERELQIEPVEIRKGDEQ
jgi:hypothetical protein